MPEYSYYWEDGLVGDSVLSPYSDDEFGDIWRILFQYDRTTQGVIRGYGDEMYGTIGVNLLSFTSGAALVDGKFYEHTPATGVAIPSPAAATRIDRVVLRKDFAAHTVRLYRIAGIEGGGAPALTQVDGVTWDIPLWQVSITIAGAMTATDERVFVMSPLSGADNLNLIIGDGINGITTGIKAWVRIPEKMELLGWYLVADAAGSIVIDIWKEVYASLPATDADTITAGAEPSLVGALTNYSTAMPGWTTTLEAGDWLYFNVDSAVTVKQVTLSLMMRRT